VQTIPSKYKKTIAAEAADPKKSQSVPAKSPKHMQGLQVPDPKEIILNQVRKYIKSNKG
jgi:hypothetical protein